MTCEGAGLSGRVTRLLVGLPSLSALDLGWTGVSSCSPWEQRNDVVSDGCAALPENSRDPKLSVLDVTVQLLAVLTPQ